MPDIEYKRLWMRVRKSGENSVLKDREMMFDPVAHEIRIGDGVNVFEDLTDIIHTDIGWYPKPDPLGNLRDAITNGTASTAYPIGTQVVLKYADPANSTEYDLPWNIVSYRKVTTEDNVEHDAAIIQAHYAIPSAYIQFDAPEPSNSDDSNRQKYGSNRWRDSAIRQWLNSNAEANAGWWTAQTSTDAAPTNPAAWVDWPGFLKCLPDGFVSRLQPVKVQTATANVDSNVVDTTYDKVWLPSKEELYSVVDTNTSVNISGVEGPYWEYWKTRMGTSSPAADNNSSTNSKRITYCVENPTSTSYVWLRSAYRSNSYYVWILSSSGYLSNNSAGNTIRAAPACAIF